MWGVPRRLSNDLLLVLALAQVLTGLIGWAWPVAQVSALYDVHRALGVALLLTLVWKQLIVRRSLRSRFGRDSSVVWGLAAGAGLLGCVALGLAWTLNVFSFESFWGYSPLNIHVALGIGLLPLVAWHAVLRRRSNLGGGRVLGRRALLRGGCSVGDTLAEADPLAGASEAAVLSVTGHRMVFPLDELRAAVLATHVGGEPLSVPHGFPVRLAAPGRRGYYWVKWLRRIDVL